MHSVAQHFMEGGWGMYPVMVFGLVLLAAAGRYAYAPDNRFVPLLVSLSVLTMASGALGFVTGLVATANAYAETTNPDPRIPFLGFGESLNDVAFALCFLVIGAILTSLGALRLARQKASRVALA